MLGNALAWLLWLFALRRLTAGAAGLGTLATPVIGVAAAWLQLGERPTAGEAAGMTLIIVALAIVSLRGPVGARRRESDGRSAATRRRESDGRSAAAPDPPTSRDEPPRHPE